MSGLERSLCRAHTRAFGRELPDRSRSPNDPQQPVDTVDSSRSTKNQLTRDPECVDKMPQARRRVSRHVHIDRHRVVQAKLLGRSRRERRSWNSEHRCRAGKASAFHTVSAQLFCFVKRSVGPGKGLDGGLAKPVLCHSD